MVAHREWPDLRKALERLSGHEIACKGDDFAKEDGPANLDIRKIHKHTAIIAIVGS
jgi:hypothetical protein